SGTSLKTWTNSVFGSSRLIRGLDSTLRGGTPRTVTTTFEIYEGPTARRPLRVGFRLSTGAGHRPEATGHGSGVGPGRCPARGGYADGVRYCCARPDRHE